MKKLILLLFTTTLFAQLNISKKIGEKIKRENGEANPGLVGSDSSGYYTISTTVYEDKVQNCIVRRFDLNGNVIIKKNLDLTNGDNKSNFGLLRFDNKLLSLITYYYDKKSSSTNVSLESLNPKTLALNGDAKIIKSLPGRLEMAFTQFKGNSDKISLVYNNGSFDENRKMSEIGVVVWNSGFNELWDKKISVSDKNGFIESMELFENGDMHVTVASEDLSTEIPLTLYSFFYSTKIAFETKIINSPRKVVDIRVAYTEANTPVVIGLYSEKNVKKLDVDRSAKGYFVQTLDTKTGKLQPAKFYPFSPATINAASGKTRDEVDYLKLSFIKLTGNTFTIVAQTQFMQGESGAFGSLILFNISASGELKWENALFKSTGARLEDLSYVDIMNNTLVVLDVDLYDDNKLGAQSLNCYQFDSKGTLIKKESVIKKELEGIPDTGSSFNISPFQIVVHRIQLVGSPVQSAVISFK